MNPRPFRFALAALLALPCTAGAHEFWIAPSRYDAAPGATIELGAAAGTGFRGERKPWSPDHAVRFVVRAAKPVDVARAATPGELTWTRFAPSDGGGALVAFESDFLPIELPAAQFNLYLKAEGLDGPLAARQGSTAPGRERYRRCAKAWLAGSDPARATPKLGLPLELVPESTPGAGTELRLQVLLEGRPVAGSLVKVWRTALSASGAPQPVFARDSVNVAWQGRTDATGRVSVPVGEAGEWLVSTVHMEPCGDRREADWESTWASLTFTRTGVASATRPASSSPAARESAAPHAARPSAGAP